MGASRAVSETSNLAPSGKVLAMSGMLQLGLHKVDDKIHGTEHGDRGRTDL